jgi:GAF domain-containing protein
VIGLLSLNSATPGFFTAAHAERLHAFADQAAVAIENAQLYSQVLRYSAQLEERPGADGELAAPAPGKPSQYSSDVIS